MEDKTFIALEKIDIVDRCKENGYSEELATSIIDDMEGNLSYITGRNTIKKLKSISASLSKGETP